MRVYSTPLRTNDWRRGMSSRRCIISRTKDVDPAEDENEDEDEDEEEDEDEDEDEARAGKTGMSVSSSPYMLLVLVCGRAWVLEVLIKAVVVAEAEAVLKP